MKTKNIREVSAGDFLQVKSTEALFPKGAIIKVVRRDDHDNLVPFLCTPRNNPGEECWVAVNEVRRVFPLGEDEEVDEGTPLVVLEDDADGLREGQRVVYADEESQTSMPYVLKKKGKTVIAYRNTLARINKGA